MKYSLKKVLRKTQSPTSTRFLPSMRYCFICKELVPSDHLEKVHGKNAKILVPVNTVNSKKRGAAPIRVSPVVVLGRRFPGRKQRKFIARVRPIAHFLPHPGGVELPDNFSLLDMGYTPPVLDQGNEGSCTGFGGYFAKGIQERVSGTFTEDISPRDIYNGAKFEGGYLDGEGAYMGDVYQNLMKRGACRMRYWEYMAGQESDIYPCPNSDGIEDGKNWKVIDFADLMKNADGSPVTTWQQADFNFRQGMYQLMIGLNPGTPWTQDWMDAWFSGVMPIPKGTVAGGHSWGIYGWRVVRDEGGNVTDVILLCQNSWGKTNAKLGLFECSIKSFVCTVWMKAGGSEVIKSIDGKSHICPEGQHWSQEQGQCVDDGSEPEPPEPTDCFEKERKCMNDADKEPDILQRFIKYILCIFDAIVCELGQEGAKRKVNALLGTKKSRTVSRSIERLDVSVSVTVKKLKK